MAGADNDANRSAIRPGPTHSTRSRAERRARRRWHRFPADAAELLGIEGFVAAPQGRGLLIQSGRALPDRLLFLRTDEQKGLVAQAARPSTTGRSHDYLALAVKVQTRLDRRLENVAKGGDLGAFIKAVVDAAAELGAEDQKVVEAERIRLGGKLPEKRERTTSVRALQGGLPSLGKRR